MTKWIELDKGDKVHGEGREGGGGGREVEGKDDQKCGGRPRRPQLTRTRIAARFPVAREKSGSATEEEKEED